MAVLIDTSPLIALERAGAMEALDALVPDEDRAISVVTASELLYGVQHAIAGYGPRRRAFVEHILANIEPLPITAQVARVHAEIWAQADTAGTPVGAHDLWIAATAISHGYGLVTGNVRDFERIPGLRVVAYP